MGHYYSEMCCEACGKIRCVCPPRPEDPDPEGFVIDNLEVISCLDYIEKYRYHKTQFSGMEDRRFWVKMSMGSMTRYKTIEEANAARRVIIQDLIYDAYADINRWQKLLEQQ